MIKCSVSIKKLQSRIKKIEKQSAFATSVMINMLAADVAEAEAKAMVRQLDRPTPWTQKAFKGSGRYPFYGSKASKYKLRAIVMAKPIQAEYLKYQVFGGSRSATGRAQPIAVGQKRNKYGNIPKGSVKRNLANKKTFSGVPNGRTTGGIYKRMGTQKKPKLRLMVKWHEKPMHYSKLFDFYGTAHKAVQRNKKRRWKAAKALTLRTAR